MSISDRAGLYPFEPNWTAHPGEHWRELIEERGFSQALLAERAGTSPKHLNMILHGRALPSVELVLRMAAALDAAHPGSERDGGRRLAKLMWGIQSNYLFDEARHARTVSLNGG